MIHEAYMPVYIGSRFSLRTGGRVRGFTRGSTRGPRGPKKKLVELEGPSHFDPGKISPQGVKLVFLH